MGDDYDQYDNDNNSAGSNVGRPTGPLGIDPLHFSVFLFGLLILFVLYLLLPKAFRKQYFNAYPKRHAWSSRSRSSRRAGGGSLGGSTINSSATPGGQQVGGGSGSGHHRQLHGVGLGAGTNSFGGQQGGVGVVGGGQGQCPPGVSAGSAGGVMPGAGSVGGSSNGMRGAQPPGYGDAGSGIIGSGSGMHPHGSGSGVGMNEEQVDFGGQQQILDMQQNDEIVISAAMQQLRDPGVLIVAHGSRGKPKTVRLQLTESAITWRTETRKKGSKDQKPKIGKLHQVPLSHIMYVDVGKQTTALRRVENASVSENLCFSLLTKEGSLDLEANSPRERDALVSCFSLVLDEVHAQNWRDIYRGPSSDMPSSFDEIDHHNNNNNGPGGPGVVGMDHGGHHMGVHPNHPDSGMGGGPSGGLPLRNNI